MNTTALAVIQPDELETIQRTGRMLANSGYFDGKGDTPQAIAMMATKILAGREIGIGPFASVNGIHIIKGKPSIGANLMASAVKGSGRYDYRVKEMSSQKCVIEFFEREGDKRVSIGLSDFTIAEATAAGLMANDTWKKFPKNMLFARALSNGVRWYCPDVFAGNTVYVPEELGAEVDAEGDVINSNYTITPQAARSEKQPAKRMADTTTGEIALQSSTVADLDGDVWFAKPSDPPTDDELAILGVWQTPDDAKAWAVNVGACENEFEAKNSLKKIVDAHGGRLIKENIAAVYLDFLRRQNEKLTAQPEPA